jgi:hypothetical protein
MFVPTLGALSVALVFIAPASAFAQDSLQKAKDLYASAAYDDALSALANVPTSESPLEVERYRAYCLIALGRIQAAEKSVEAVIRAGVTMPAATDVSPRIQEVFDRTRRDLLPEIVRERYGQAKAAYARKDRSAAVDGFVKVVETIEATEGSLREDLDEYHFLAVGFLELSRALPDPAAVASVAPAPKPSPAAPAPSIETTPPVAIRQDVPPWVPIDALSRAMTFSGAIRVSVDAEGKVAEAQMERSVHPAYDPLLLAAARHWTYTPATRGGSRLPSEVIVEIQLKPSR